MTLSNINILACLAAYPFHRPCRSPSICMIAAATVLILRSPNLLALSISLDLLMVCKFVDLLALWRFLDLSAVSSLSIYRESPGLSALFISLDLSAVSKFLDILVFSKILRNPCPIPRLLDPSRISGNLVIPLRIWIPLRSNTTSNYRRARSFLNVMIWCFFWLSTRITKNHPYLSLPRMSRNGFLLDPYFWKTHERSERLERSHRTGKYYSKDLKYGGRSYAHKSVHVRLFT